VAKYQKQASLAEVKQALAAKCERLAQTTGSKPKRKSLLHHAAIFRRQAVDIRLQSE